MLKYILLAGSFVAAVAGASTGSTMLVVLGVCPGIVEALALVVSYGANNA